MGNFDRPLRRNWIWSLNAVAASVVWFPLYLMLLPLLVLVPDPPPASIVLLMVAGNLAWLVAAYCIYDALFGPDGPQ
jgi:hypothetical protein